MCLKPFAVRRLWAVGPWVLLLGVLFAGVLGAPGRAEAAPSCSASVTPGDFGTVDVLAGGTTNTTAILTFACSGMVPAVPVTLCPNLDAGSGGGDGSGARLLAGPSSAGLSFQIYQDAARSISWGSTSFLAFGSTPTITVTPNGSGVGSTTRTLYASVTAVSTAPPGTYTSSFANQNFFWGLNLLSCAGITIGTTIAPATFSFTAAVAANCGISATTLNFGAVGVLTSAITAQNQVSVKCTATTPYTLSLNNGLTGTGPTARVMTKTGGAVTYGIYRDGGYSLPWGDVSAGAAFAQSATGTGGSQTFTGYGKVPVQTTPAPGGYADTIVATLTY